jgi:hypothetical protein
LRGAQKKKEKKVSIFKKVQSSQNRNHNPAYVMSTIKNNILLMFMDGDFCGILACTSVILEGILLKPNMILPGIKMEPAYSLTDAHL